TRTPTSLSPASIKSPSVVLSGPSMDLTLRPMGRPRKSAILTSLTSYKKDNLSHGQSSLVTSDILKLRPRVRPRKSENLTGSTATKHDTILIGQSSLLTADMCKFRGKMFTRGKVMLGTELKEPPKLLKDLIKNEHPKSASFIDNISKEASTSSKKHEIDFQLTTDIRHMLDSINPLVKDFRMAGERIKSSDVKILKLKLNCKRKKDGRDYNLPTASKVTTINIGDFNSIKNNRDIILHCQDSDFMRIELAADLNFSVQLCGKKVLLPSSFTESPSLMKDLKDVRMFGRVKGAIYTSGFQKRGLLHCHILLWLETEDKITTTAKIDKYISSEIPNKDEDPDLN
nr:PIF1 DNA helicase/replication protein A1-like protein [Tanacetum cinerariifolium]